MTHDVHAVPRASAGKRLGVAITSLAFFAVVLISLPASQAEAARIEPWNKKCLQDQARWEKKKGHKAVAVTKVYPNGQGCGHSWGKKTVAAAKQDAMRQCVSLLRQNMPGSRDGCVIILAR